MALPAREKPGGARDERKTLRDRRARTPEKPRSPVRGVIATRREAGG